MTFFKTLACLAMASTLTACATRDPNKVYQLDHEEIDKEMSIANQLLTPLDLETIYEDKEVASADVGNDGTSIIGSTLVGSLLSNGIYGFLMGASSGDNRIISTYFILMMDADKYDLTQPQDHLRLKRDAYQEILAQAKDNMPITPEFYGDMLDMSNIVTTENSHCVGLARNISNPNDLYYANEINKQGSVCYSFDIKSTSAAYQRNEFSPQAAQYLPFKNTLFVRYRHTGNSILALYADPLYPLTPNRMPIIPVELKNRDHTLILSGSKVTYSNYGYVTKRYIPAVVTQDAALYFAVTDDGQSVVSSLDVLKKKNQRGETIEALAREHQQELANN